MMDDGDIVVEDIQWILDFKTPCSYQAFRLPRWSKEHCLPSDTGIDCLPNAQRVIDSSYVWTMTQHKIQWWWELVEDNNEKTDTCHSLIWNEDFSWYAFVGKEKNQLSRIEADAVCSVKCMTTPFHIWAYVIQWHDHKPLVSTPCFLLSHLIYVMWCVEKQR